MITKDELIHCAVAILLQVIVAALMWPFFGLRAGLWAGAMVGAATFLSREIAQASYKAIAPGKDGVIWHHVNWAEAWKPAVAVYGIAAVGTLVFQ